MAFTDIAGAKKDLLLLPAERAKLAKLLNQGLVDEPRTDAEIRSDLLRRLNRLVSGKDAGLRFDEVFGRQL